ncbi:MAG: hypothetical protein KDK78_05960 [Chlamydiia bacterium]|nr:hypothetical protein [Chlamydiia bacterium]
MDDPTQILQAQQGEPVQPSAAEAAQKEAPTKAPAKEFIASDAHIKNISSMEDLRKKNKDLYRIMMEGIAQQILSDMRRSQQRLKDTIRRGRQR